MNVAVLFFLSFFLLNIFPPQHDQTVLSECCVVLSGEPVGCPLSKSEEKIPTAILFRLL